MPLNVLVEFTGIKWQLIDTIPFHHEHFLLGARWHVVRVFWLICDNVKQLRMCPEVNKDVASPSGGFARMEKPIAEVQQNGVGNV